MRLHWFREHKQIVYYIICPLIVISMSFFGIFGMSGKGGNGVNSGLDISYVVGDKSVHLSPTEVLQRRVVLYKWVGFYYPDSRAREDNPTTSNIGIWAAENEAARQRGFEVGFEEQKALLRNAVKYKIASIDRLEKPSDVNPTQDSYEKLLEQLSLTAPQFETLIHDLALREKFHHALRESVEFTDSQLFAKYCEEKEVDRFRYRVYKSSDYLAKTTEPKAEEVKKFYDDNLKNKTQGMYKDIYMSPSTLALDAFFIKDEKIFANLKPEEKDLKETYESLKTIYWKATPPETGFIAYEKVPKADLEKQWLATKKAALMRTVQENLIKSIAELKAEQDKFLADPANKGKDFDMKAFAAKHNLTYWSTPEQTEEKYTPGKLAVDAPDLTLGKAIFGFTKLPPTAPPSVLENMKKQMLDFTPIEWIDHEKPELGGIVARKKTYSEEKTKTLDEAKAKIIETLKEKQAVELAKKAAETQRDAWRRGEGLPANLEDGFEEVTSESKPNNPLVREFRYAPKPVGEVLDVAEGAPERTEGEKANPKDDEQSWFYLGCVVERKLPTQSGFQLMTEGQWSRDSARNGSSSPYGQRMPGMLDKDYASTLGLMVEQIKSYIMTPDRQTEPDVRTSLRNSDN